MIQPTILWQGTIDESRVSINFIEAHESNRRIDPEIEGRLPDMWHRKTIEAAERDEILYDGTSYRLETFSVSSDGLEITVSPMKFSIRSTLKRVPELEELGEEFYSHGLSVGGFVITSDGQYVFAQKSARSSSLLREDLVGGVYEKFDTGPRIGIFDMNREELKEELNVDPTMIESMRILGIIRSSTTDIIIITTTRLHISASELQEIFEMREDEELQGIVYVAAENLHDYLNQLGGYKPLMSRLIDC
jgi:hypothetical protein